jgi:hypothetical protein
MREEEEFKKIQRQRRKERWLSRLESDKSFSFKADEVILELWIKVL